MPLNYNRNTLQNLLRHYSVRSVFSNRVIVLLLILTALINCLTLTISQKERIEEVIIQESKECKNERNKNLIKLLDCVKGNFRSRTANSIGSTGCKESNKNIRVLLKHVRQEPILTLVSSWKSQADKTKMNLNTIKNWASLKPFIRPVLFTDDEELASECRKYGWDVLPLLHTAAGGVPVLKHMIIKSVRRFNSTFYGYANGDILFSGSLLTTLRGVLSSPILDLKKPALVIGRRTNVDEVHIDTDASLNSLEEIADTKGFLFKPYALDFFLTNKVFPWKDIPEVVIGRIAYDNWLVLYANENGYQMVDASRTLQAVHQTTSYGNYEGFNSPNVHYNLNLLYTLYGEINYVGGETTCAKYYTDINSTCNFEIKQRIVEPLCLTSKYPTIALPLIKLKRLFGVLY
ncbi:hypothetical protein KUTeg_000934 [Tegillarca granosa]|uniref:Uncharacterized protein n=1 Tax=Tegillarca granosa TaxID=220873 RepID=A0ABQ9FW77_TEGGR|nr:hypothetical protein KUTeg_000934 [Tegillarca granosa]